MSTTDADVHCISASLKKVLIGVLIVVILMNKDQ